jgi:hypothetical protein
VQKSIASLMAVGLLLLAACGTGGEVEPGPVTSFEDIAGTTYERQGIGALAISTSLRMGPGTVRRTQT